MLVFHQHRTTTIRKLFENRKQTNTITGDRQFFAHQSIIYEYAVILALAKVIDRITWGILQNILFTRKTNKFVAKINNRIFLSSWWCLRPTPWLCGHWCVHLTIYNLNVSVDVGCPSPKILLRIFNEFKSHSSHSLARVSLVEGGHLW